MLFKDEPSLQDRSIDADDVQGTPPEKPRTTKSGSSSINALLRSISVGSSAQALKSELELNVLSSRKTSTPPEATRSAEQQESVPGNAQLQPQHPQTDRHTAQAAGGQDVIISQGPPTTKPTEHSAPPSTNGATTLDQLPAFWNKYNAKRDEEYKKFGAPLVGDLDSAVILAGLLSAIDAAFIIELYKGLKPDPSDEATKLLRSVVLLLHNSTYTDESMNLPFTATPQNFRINNFLVLSLCGSLNVAFGGLLIREWLTQYDQDSVGTVQTPEARARQRQAKYDEQGFLGFEGALALLTPVMLLSLLSFLIALADFIWPLNPLAASIIIAVAASVFLSYCTTTVLASINPRSPFQTRLSVLLARLARALELRLARAFKLYLARAFNLRLARAFKLQEQVLIAPLTGQAVALASRCIVYLLERMSTSEDLYSLAEAVDLLPANDKAPEIVEALTTFHLKPTYADGQVHLLGFRGPNQGAVIRMLRIVLEKWRSPGLEGPSSMRYTPLLDDPQLREGLALALWDAFLAHPGDQEVYNSTRQVFLTLSHPNKDLGTSLMAGKFINRDGVMGNLKQGEGGVVRERTFRLVCLLPSLGCAPDDIMPLARTTASSYPHILEKLPSTMWEEPGHKADLESFWVATLRAEILSSHRLDNLEKPRFSEYLASWFKAFSLPNSHSSPRYQGQDQQRSLYWTYLFSLRNLLNHGESKAWAQELARAGHLSCLSAVLREYPHNNDFCGEPLALWALLQLWDQEEPQVKPGKSIFLAKDCVQLIVNSVVSCSSRTGLVAEMIEQCGRDYLPTIWASEVEAAEEAAKLLEWLFPYLKAAKEGDLMGRRLVKLTIQAYPRWRDKINSLLPPDRQHADQSEELRSMFV